MNKIVVLTGIPGSGKTTVLEAVLALTSKEGMKFLPVNYGTVMFEAAREMKLVTDRDQMRKLDPSKQKDMQKMAGKKIASMARTASLIVDTHCTINTHKGYLPGLPEWVLREMMPDTIVLIEADPKEIYTRRNSDKTRARDAETSDDIHAHQQINRAASIAYGMMTGATTKIIKNEQGKAEKAAKEILDLLR